VCVWKWSLIASRILKHISVLVACLTRYLVLSWR
jgi:hypothetical protein